MQETAPGVFPAAKHREVPLLWAAAGRPPPPPAGSAHALCRRRAGSPRAGRGRVVPRAALRRSFWYSGLRWFRPTLEQHQYRKEAGVGGSGWAREGNERQDDRSGGLGTTGTKFISFPARAEAGLMLVSWRSSMSSSVCRATPPRASRRTERPVFPGPSAAPCLLPSGLGQQVLLGELQPGNRSSLGPMHAAGPP